MIWDVKDDVNNFAEFTLAEKSKIFEMTTLFMEAKSLIASWIPIEVKQYLENEFEQIKPPADFTRAFTIPAISTKAMDVLKPLIENNVELLPIKADVGSYSVLNVGVIDCLDVEHSAVERFKSSGRVMDVEKYAFYWDRIANIHMFRIKELGLSQLFVSDLFKTTYENNRLTGLLFHPISLVET